MRLAGICYTSTNRMVIQDLFLLLFITSATVSLRAHPDHSYEAQPGSECRRSLTRRPCDVCTVFNTQNLYGCTTIYYCNIKGQFIVAMLRGKSETVRRVYTIPTATKAKLYFNLPFI